MSLIENEQTKLTATFFSNYGLALVVTGFAAPLVAFTMDLPSSPPIRLRTVLFSLAWLAAGLTLHVIARAILKRLKP
jgi:hypothetical protein